MLAALAGVHRLGPLHLALLRVAAHVTERARALTVTISLTLVRRYRRFTCFGCTSFLLYVPVLNVPLLAAPVLMPLWVVTASARAYPLSVYFQVHCGQSDLVLRAHDDVRGGSEADE